MIITATEKWKWDTWQQQVLDHTGCMTLRCGRQVGKSECVSAKAAQFAITNPGTTTLIIAASQRQSSLLFEKVRANLDKLEEEKGDILPDTQRGGRRRMRQDKVLYFVGEVKEIKINPELIIIPNLNITSHCSILKRKTLKNIRIGKTM